MTDLRSLLSPDPIDIDVGRRIRVRRKWLGVSQASLAEHLGVSFQQVQKYERGFNRVSASVLVRIAEKLETTVSALVGETGVHGQPNAIFEMLALPGALQLLDAFTSVENSALRSALLDLVHSLAETDPT